MKEGNWVHYVEQDLGRREERQRFLWAIFAGAIAGAALLLQWNWTLASTVIALSLGAALYWAVGAPLVISVQTSLRPPVLGTLATIDTLVGKRYLELFGLPGALRVWIALDCLALGTVGMTAAWQVGVGYSVSKLLATIAGVWILSSTFLYSLSLFLTGKFLAALVGRNVAVGHRTLRGSTGKLADALPGIKEMRTSASDWFGTSWKSANEISSVIQKTSKLRIIDVAALGVVSCVLLLEVARDAVLPTLLSAGGIALGAFAARLGLLLHAEFARAYFEQLLFMISNRGIKPSQIPYFIAMVHALSELSARPIARADIMWSILRMDEIATSSRKEV